MPDFNDFRKFLQEHDMAVLFQLSQGLEKIPETQRTITAEEWQYIEKLIFKSNITFLEMYHRWLCREAQQADSE